LRNTVRHGEVAGSKSTSVHRVSVMTQIREVAIGVSKTPLVTPTPKQQTTGVWGVSQQLDEHTWTIKVGEDAKNGTAQEILSALNMYRQRNGKGTLAWDEKLASYAESRASYFTSKGNLDGHVGFSDYINNQDGFHKLGFLSLGENSSLGYTLEAVHLIEWVYAGDKPHNDNQLSQDWSYIGIGVDGAATDLIFGGKKM